MITIAEAIVDIADKFNKLNDVYLYLVVSEKSLDDLKRYIYLIGLPMSILNMVYIGTHIEDFEIVVVKPGKREKYNYKNLHKYVNRLYNTRVLA